MGGCVFSRASLLQAATSGSSDGGGGETSGDSVHPLQGYHCCRRINEYLSKLHENNYKGKYFVVLINILTVKIRNSVNILLFKIALMLTLI